jgi:WD40 repeat protein
MFIMNAVNADIALGFYVVGGTMRPDSPSYVERQADGVLYEGLASGEFCYVLTARQMGKSSLMIRTAARLREAGIGVAVLDLTAVGQNLTAEQWYGGLIAQIGQRLYLEDELIEFWTSQPLLGPMQRWVKAIRAVVLPRYPGRLVIFIDEIDTVRSLPFSTDEFFAGIRELYNQRSEDLDLQRVTFCLLGVATPSDLIRDTRTTPFNIGRRIELHDFTEAEAAPLAYGLQDRSIEAEAILKRILHWTGGHPYLTQRLCQAISEDGSIHSDTGLDKLCEELFFSRRAQECDDNLLFVRERLLRNEMDLAELLELYAKVVNHKAVRDDETNPLVDLLRLSGITRAEGGWLKVRNRIYARVFDRAWVTANMPDAEVRRQRTAYRRGLWRMASVSVLILILVGSLAVIAIKQRNRAQMEASVNRRLLSYTQLGWAPQELDNVPAEKVEELLTAALYHAQIKQAVQDWENSNVNRVEELLNATCPLPGMTDYRGFEWYRLWHLTHSEVLRLEEGKKVVSATFLDDGHTLAIGEASRVKLEGPDEYVIKLYDLEARTEVSSFNVQAGRHFDLVSFSPDKRHVAVNGPDKDILLLDVRSGHRIATFEGHSEPIMSIAFSPDGRYLASGDLGGIIKLWNITTGQEQLKLIGPKQWVWGVAFSPDSRLLATTHGLKKVKIWDATTGRELQPFATDRSVLVHAAFLPDGKRLATTSKDGQMYLWDLRTRQITTTLAGHVGEAEPIAFSTDGKMMAIGGVDREVRLWDISKEQELGTIRGHGSEVKSVAWSPDGKYLATGSLDGTVKVWDVVKSEFILPANLAAEYLATTFSTDGDLIAVGTDEDSRVKLWNVSTGQELAELEKPENKIHSASFSKDKRYLATGGMDRLVKIWDATTGRLIHTLNGHTGYVLGVDFSPEGKLLISGGDDRSLIIWDVASGQQLAIFNEDNNSYRAIFSPDGKLVASACRDGSLKLWDVNTRTIINTFVGHTDQVRAIAFSSDGRQLATGGKDNTVRLWDIATGQQLKNMAQSDYVQRVAFSSDGKRMVTGGTGGAVKLWDVATWQELMTLKGHTGNITSVTFSLDNLSLATSGDDGTVRLWHAAAIK